MKSRKPIPMKITNELRAAVKAVADIKSREPFNRDALRAKRKAAVRELVRRKPSLKKALSGYSAAIRAKSRARETLRKAGVYPDAILDGGSYNDPIESDDKFESAGGKPCRAVKFPDYTLIMAMLAGMTEEKGLKYLKSLGIRWD